MALNFLSTVLPIAGTALQLFGGQKNIQERQQPTQAEQSILSAQRALLNPDSPEFQALQRQERQLINNDFARSLTDLERRNRLAASMGRTQFLDPERRDESINRLISQQMPNAQNTAFLNAVRKLQAGGTMQQGLISPQMQRQGLAGQQQYATGDLLTKLPDFLRGIRSLGGSSRAPSYSYT